MEQVLPNIDLQRSFSVPVRPMCQGGLVDLPAAPREAWEALGSASVEANGFLDPAFVQAAAQHARRGRGARLLLTSSAGGLCGLLPVMPALSVYGLPLPALVASQPYNLLSTPLVHRADPVGAADALLGAAAAAGARVLVLPMMPLAGPAWQALQQAMATRRLGYHVDAVHSRAVLETCLDDETYLRSGFGARRLKELRRQGHRLDELGAVDFVIHRLPESVEQGVERFLALEAEGWKGRRGTALGQHPGDTAFVRTLAADLSRRAAFDVAELTLDGRTIASGLIIRQADRALFFKIAYDETLARYSVGVQLTLRLTRALIADPTIRHVDSTAMAGHPMIDHLWRERLEVGQVTIQTCAGDPLAAATAGLLRLRHAARTRAKHLYHSLRNRLETSP